MSFKNKVVIVTGAGSGIGAATAILFAKEKAILSIADRDYENLLEVNEKCNKHSVCYPTHADVSKMNDVDVLIESTLKVCGKIDVLINNAGNAYLGSILDGNLINAFDKTISNNLRATVLVTTSAAPHLIKTKGNIINLSSVAAKTIPLTPNLTSHSISKAGIDAFTRAAASDLSVFGVRVNSINPAVVETNFLKNAKITSTWDEMKDVAALNRISQPEEIAELILFLAGDKAKSITGCNYVIDNGYMLKRF